jgi:hypothetical protein
VSLFRFCYDFLGLSVGRRPTVGPQTLDLLIGVRIPASQLDLKLKECPPPEELVLQFTGHTTMSLYSSDVKDTQSDPAIESGLVRSAKTNWR